MKFLAMRACSRVMDILFQVRRTFQSFAIYRADLGVLNLGWISRIENIFTLSRRDERTLSLKGRGLRLTPVPRGREKLTNPGEEFLENSSRNDVKAESLHGVKHFCQTVLPSGGKKFSLLTRIFHRRRP